MKSPHSIEFLRQGPTLLELKAVPKGTLLVCVKEIHPQHPLSEGLVVELVSFECTSFRYDESFVVVKDNEGGALSEGGFYQRRFVPYREGATKEELLAWWKWLRLTHAKQD